MADPSLSPAPGLGIVVTCDFDTVTAEHHADSDKAVGADETFVHYRVPQPAVLRVYSGKKNGSSLELLSTQRILAARPGHDCTVPAFGLTGKQSLSVSFDSTGALTSISSDTTGAAASAAAELGDLPTALKDAFDAGTDISTPFTSASQATALQSQVNAQTARSALNAPPDPNQALETQVAQAELEARLKVAGQLASGETTQAVVVLGSTA